MSAINTTTAKNKANIILNETLVSANTAFRVGDTINEVINCIDKALPSVDSLINSSGGNVVNAINSALNVTNNIQTILNTAVLNQVITQSPITQTDAVASGIRIRTIGLDKSFITSNDGSANVSNGDISIPLYNGNNNGLMTPLTELSIKDYAASLTPDLSPVQSLIDTINSNLLTTNNNILTNSNNISNLLTDVTTNTTDIDDIKTRLTTDETNITNNTNSINSLNTQVTTNTTNISNNTSAIQLINNKISTLENIGGKWVGKTFATKADLLALTIDPTWSNGDYAYVQVDETLSGLTTLYFLENNAWVFGLVIDTIVTSQYDKLTALTVLSNSSSTNDATNGFIITYTIETFSPSSNSWSESTFTQTIPIASSTVNGLMSSTIYTGLNRAFFVGNMSMNTNNSTDVMLNYGMTNVNPITGGTVTYGGMNIPAVNISTNKAGVMTVADKVKLDSLTNSNITTVNTINYDNTVSSSIQLNSPTTLTIDPSILNLLSINKQYSDTKLNLTQALVDALPIGIVFANLYYNINISNNNINTSGALTTLTMGTLLNLTDKMIIITTSNYLLFIPANPNYYNNISFYRTRSTSGYSAYMLYNSDLPTIIKNQNGLFNGIKAINSYSGNIFNTNYNLLLSVNNGVSVVATSTSTNSYSTYINTCSNFNAYAVNGAGFTYVNSNPSNKPAEITSYGPFMIFTALTGSSVGTSILFDEYGLMWYRLNNSTWVLSMPSLFDNNKQGTIKGTLQEGYVNNDGNGFGVVNGWSDLSNRVTNNTNNISNLALLINNLPQPLILISFTVDKVSGTCTAKFNNLLTENSYYLFKDLSGTSIIGSYNNAIGTNTVIFTPLSVNDILYNEYIFIYY